MPRKGTTVDKPDEPETLQPAAADSEQSTAAPPIPTGPARETPEWALARWTDQPNPSTAIPRPAPFSQGELDRMAEFAGALNPAPAVAGDVGKRCPQCGASKFQGVYYRGSIVNGRLVPEEALYQCVQCHAVRPLNDLVDYTIAVLSFGQPAAGSEGQG